MFTDILWQSFFSSPCVEFNPDLLRRRERRLVVSSAKAVTVRMLDFSSLRSALSSATVVILGDIILDHYVEGDVSRISPEAPVTVLHAQVERWALGGAANVAANVAVFGAKAQLLGLIGTDEVAERLRSCLEPLDQVSAYLTTDSGRPTTIKSRYIGRRQQIVRVDREDNAPPSPIQQRQLLETLDSTLKSGDVLVLSDYGKGVLTERVLADAIDIANQRSAYSIVDPKRPDLSFYKGASLITPNRRELTAATGLPTDSDAEAEAAALRASLVTNASILVTRSEKGMSYFSANSPPIHHRTMAREVFDVSGAGDTVVAIFAASYAAKLDIRDALQLANAAAGVVVGKHGTSTATLDEVQQWLAGMNS